MLLLKKNPQGTRSEQHHHCVSQRVCKVTGFKVHDRAGFERNGDCFARPSIVYSDGVKSRSKFDLQYVSRVKSRRSLFVDQDMNRAKIAVTGRTAMHH